MTISLEVKNSRYAYREGRGRRITALTCGMAGTKDSCKSLAPWKPGSLRLVFLPRTFYSQNQVLQRRLEPTAEQISKKAGARGKS